MHPILLKIGSFTVYTYGLFVFLGVLGGFLISKREALREGIDSAVFYDIVFWAVLFGFLGAKLLYLLVEFNSFLADPWAMLRSGFVFYGAILGVLPVYFLSKKHKIDFLKLADVITVGVPLGHAFGRIGCFFYGCCYGRHTDSFIGMLFPLDSPAGFSGAKVIPTQLISAFSLFLIFLLILRIQRKKKNPGQTLFSYLVIYGLFRFIIEFFRGDPRGGFLFLSTSQIISIFMVIAGIFLLFRLRRS